MTITVSPPKPDKRGEIDLFEALRWMITVMDRGDKSLHFVASILAQAAQRGGATDRQHEAVLRCFERLMFDYESGFLECVGGLPASTSDAVVTHIDFSAGKKRGPKRPAKKDALQ